jgi:hypothetical protein
MADKLFTLHIVILNHPAALPDAAEQRSSPAETGRWLTIESMGGRARRRRLVGPLGFYRSKS